MLTNCFRFAPRDSVPGLIAKICKYLKDHPGWSEEELEDQIKKFVSNTGVESFNGRTGIVTLDKKDVNNLKIASAYFAEGEETIDELDLNALYNDGVRFVFTTWNSVTSGYDLSFVLEYFDGSGEVVYYPFSSGGSGGGNIISVNGKTGIVELNLSDILGDSGAQVKLCTATEFTSTNIETWNAYYNDGYRIVGVVNSNVTAVDYLYILKQDINNHKPIMVLGSASTSSVLSVNNQSGNVILDVVDVSENDSENEFAKLFINETEEYPIIPAADSDALGGKPPDYYATREGFDDLKNDKADNAGWAPNKNVVTDAVGKLTTEDKPNIPSKLPNPFAVTINGQSYDGSKAVEMTVSGLPDGGTTGQVLTKVSNANQDAEWKDQSGGLQMKRIYHNEAPDSDFPANTIPVNAEGYDFALILVRNYKSNEQYLSFVCPIGKSAETTLAGNITNNQYVRVASRTITITNNQMIVDNAYSKALNSTSSETSNGFLTPYEVYGIKGVTTE